MIKLIKSVNRPAEAGLGQSTFGLDKVVKQFHRAKPRVYRGTERLINFTTLILIVGLGNLGEKFSGTRHNIGREILMEWQKKSGAAPFEFDKKNNALVSKGKKAPMLLPETMMNKSGNAVAHAARFYKIKPKDIFVIHDDADIELGRVKLSFGKHSAGHKGVESVKRALGTWDFWRFRIGIQKKKRVDAMKLVLQKFAPAEESILKKAQKKLTEGLRLLVEEGAEKTLNYINQN